MSWAGEEQNRGPRSPGERRWVCHLLRLRGQRHNRGRRLLRRTPNFSTGFFNALRQIPYLPHLKIEGCSGFLQNVWKAQVSTNPVAGVKAKTLLDSAKLFSHVSVLILVPVKTAFISHIYSKAGKATHFLRLEVGKRCYILCLLAASWGST